METDKETHSQTIGEPQRIMWKRGRKNCESQRGQRHHKKTTESTNLSSEGFTENETPARELA